MKYVDGIVDPWLPNNVHIDILVDFYKKTFHQNNLNSNEDFLSYGMKFVQIAQSVF